MGARGRCAPGAPAVCKLLAAGQLLGLSWGAAGAMDTPAVATLGASDPPRPLPFARMNLSNYKLVY